MLALEREYEPQERNANCGTSKPHVLQVYINLYMGDALRTAESVVKDPLPWRYRNRRKEWLE